MRLRTRFVTKIYPLDYAMSQKRTDTAIAKLKASSLTDTEILQEIEREGFANPFYGK